MRPHLLAMVFEQLAPFRFRAAALLAQGGVAQHFADRHPGGFQSPDEGNPREDRSVVVALVRMVTVGIGQQANPLIVADGMG